MRFMASPMISVLRSTTHLRIMSFSNKSYLFGKPTKQLSISLIASSISWIGQTSSTAINHLFRAIYICNEVFVTQTSFFNQIDFTAEKLF